MATKTEIQADHTDPPKSGEVEAAAPAAAAHEIIEQLQERVGPEEDAQNRRRSERRPWITPLTILIEDPQGKPRTLDVTTHDISTGGFSFVYRQFVHLNTKVRVHFESLSGRPSLDGIVRSCSYVGGMHHRVGVQFAST